MRRWVKAGVILVVLGIVTIVACVAVGADTCFYRTETGEMMPRRETLELIENTVDQWEGKARWAGRPYTTSEWDTTDFTTEEWEKIEPQVDDWNHWFSNRMERSEYPRLVAKKLDVVKDLVIEVDSGDVRIVRLKGDVPSLVSYDPKGSNMQISRENGRIQIRGEAWNKDEGSVLIALHEDTLQSLSLKIERGDVILEGIASDQSDIVIEDGHAIFSDTSLGTDEGAIEKKDQVSIRLEDGDLVTDALSLKGGVLALDDGDLVVNELSLSDMKLHLPAGDCIGEVDELEDVEVDVMGGMILTVGEVKGKNLLASQGGDVTLTMSSKLWNVLDRHMIGRDIIIDDELVTSPYKMKGSAGALTVDCPDSYVVISIEN